MACLQQTFNRSSSLSYFECVGDFHNPESRPLDDCRNIKGFNWTGVLRSSKAFKRQPIQFLLRQSRNFTVIIFHSFKGFPSTYCRPCQALGYTKQLVARFWAETNTSKRISFELAVCARCLRDHRLLQGGAFLLLPASPSFPPPNPTFFKVWCTTPEWAGLGVFEAKIFAQQY